MAIVLGGIPQAGTLASSLIKRIGYRIRTTISASSDPSVSEILAWIEETCRWIQDTCVNYGSELGRVIANFTLEANKQEYDDLQLQLLAVMEEGWIIEDNNYYPVKLVNKENLPRLHASSTDKDRPTYFYVTHDNKIGFIAIPDDNYNFYLPYWPVISINSTSDVIPFNKAFDEVIVEAVSIRALNREEYNVQFEQGWLSWLSDYVVRTIQRRRRFTGRIARREV